MQRERQQQALQLRLGGRTYEEVARAVGYLAKSAAYKAVEGALREVTRESAESLLAKELMRLDSVEVAAWEAWEKSKQDEQSQIIHKMPDGQNERECLVVTTSQSRCGDPRYLAIVLKAQDSRARLLGLDAL